MLDLKQKKRGRISEYTNKFSTAVYTDAAKPWAADGGAVVAFPCATQNEVTEEDAHRLVDAGVQYVFEGAPRQRAAQRRAQPAAAAVPLRVAALLGAPCWPPLG